MAIFLYTGGVKYLHLIDATMDNPWVRVVLSDIDRIQNSGIDFSEVIRDIRLGHILKD
jgi:hypothetical protein